MAERNPQNRLKDEKSPYLLQHAANPVDWYAWGDEAFEKAEAEDKPIFLSIGYSTCHWCHVMAHESFEDSEVARLMNDAFICIKVDREERPDIDNVYMRVCQMMTGRGGWPLTIVMTPDKRPFFAGTYFPKQSRYGQPGLLDIIPRLRDIWKNNQGDIEKTIESVSKALDHDRVASIQSELNHTIMDHAYNQLHSQYDGVHGGFGKAPKFPTPHHLLFLLKYYYRTSENRALEMVEGTLQSMRHGGMFDQLGFGFHRYSTDAHWLLPHFEKMLYDQAMLAIAYIEAFQITDKLFYAETAKEIFQYVSRDMTAPDGGFFSAEDADSEGEEGKFYVWSIEEIREILGEEDADFFSLVYQLKPEGNFHDEATGQATGTNILHLRKSIENLAEELGLPVDIVQTRLEKAREKLFSQRKKRVRPHLDDKILTDWNGLLITALAKGARVFENSTYLENAIKCVDFVLVNLRSSDGRLLHRYRDDEATIPGQLDDYAFFVWGLLELYDATFEIKYLQTAMELSNIMIEDFWDEDGGGFFLTADHAEKLLYRPKEIYDGAIPSGNSVAFMNMIRLGRITADPKWEELADRLSRSFSGQITASPTAQTYFLSGLEFALGNPVEVIIVGDPNADDTKAMLKALGNLYAPNMVVLFKSTTDNSGVLEKIAKYVKDYDSTDGKSTAYVCRERQCERPTPDVKEMIDQITRRDLSDKKYSKY